mgnify:CR=1 FL=1
MTLPTAPFLPTADDTPGARFQKLVEEGPVIAAPAAPWARMAPAAVRLAVELLRAHSFSNVMTSSSRIRTASFRFASAISTLL